MIKTLFWFLVVSTVPLGAAAPNPFIMSWGQVTADNLSGYLLYVNPLVDPSLARDVALYYVEECAAEGINSDIAFAQMLLETSFLRFGGQVRVEQNNFAGLGALDGGAPGLSFSTKILGIRAHIQHLKAYSSGVPLKKELVNPRFGFISRGIAPTVYDLSGRWASDPLYGEKIMKLVSRLKEFNLGQMVGLPLEPSIPKS